MNRDSIKVMAQCIAYRMSIFFNWLKFFSVKVILRFSFYHLNIKKTLRKTMKTLWSKLNQKYELSWLTALIAFAAIFVFTQNIVFWRAVFRIVPFNSVQDYLFVGVVLIILLSLMTILFSLILWSRRLTLVILVALMGLSASFNYFSYHYQIYMDRDMLTNIIETNTLEVVNLLSFELLAWITLGAIVPFWLLTRIQIKPIIWWKGLLQRLCVVTGALVLISGTLFGLNFYKDFASFFRNNRQVVKLIMPSSFVASYVSYAKKNYSQAQPFKSVGDDAVLVKPEAQKKTLMVMFLGETARRQSFSLNGYDKNTNPKLSMQDNLVSFQNVVSCGTATAVSVPCLFSKMTRSEFDKVSAENQDNVMDVLQKAGYKVLWRENDNGCKEVCNRIPTQNVSDYTSAKPSAGALYYDEYLLEGLDDYIMAQDKDDNLVIVLHMNGSHGPTYYQRYPKESRVFTPTCDTNRIETCDTEVLKNTYDNTIAYTDDVINRGIELLKRYEDQYETSMLYVSDHGQSLGEKGFYLHGAPYMIAPEEQTSIPLIFWGNDEFYNNRGLTLSCVQKKAQQENYSHDNIFHTLLGLLQVQTNDYDPKLNIFTEC